jgi:hypothetical protein
MSSAAVTLTARQSNGKVHAVVSTERDGNVYVSKMVCGRSVPHIPAASAEPRTVTCGACAKKL